jgi:hypothetical protein
VLIELRRAGRKIVAFKKQHPNHATSETESKELLELELDLMYIKVSASLHLQQNYRAFASLLLGECILTVHSILLISLNVFIQNYPKGQEYIPIYAESVEEAQVKTRTEIRENTKKALESGELKRSTGVEKLEGKTASAIGKHPASNWSDDDDEEEEEEEEENERENKKQKTK